MSFVDENLGKNEKVLVRARISLVVFLPVLIVLALVVMMLFLLGNLITTTQEIPIWNTIKFFISVFLIFLVVREALKALIYFFTTEFAVTNRRLIAKTGLFGRHTVEMHLMKVESVSVNQRIAGRVCNYGTITVTGTGGTREKYWAISEPLEIRKRFYEIHEWYMRGYAEYQARKAAE